MAFYYYLYETSRHYCYKVHSWSSPCLHLLLLLLLRSTAMTHSPSPPAAAAAQVQIFRCALGADIEADHPGLVRTHTHMIRHQGLGLRHFDVLAGHLMQVGGWGGGGGAVPPQRTKLISNACSSTPCSWPPTWPLNCCPPTC